MNNARISRRRRRAERFFFFDHQRFQADQSHSPGDGETDDASANHDGVDTKFRHEGFSTIIISIRTL